jgi:hypothetical protein
VAPEPLRPDRGGRANLGRSREHFRWDDRHHQPHTDLSKWRKLWMGRVDLASHVGVVGSGLRHGWPVVRSYRRLLAAPRGAERVRPGALGVAVSPTAATLARYTDNLEELGVRSLLLRVPSWDPDPLFTLRDEFALPADKLGRFLDSRGVRISECQLGLFGWAATKGAPGWKPVRKLEAVAAELRQAITENARAGGITCPQLCLDAATPDTASQ